MWTIAAHPHLAILAVAGTSQNIELWQLEDRTRDTTLIGHQQRIRSIVFNYTGDRLASRSDDRTLKLWDLDRRQCLHTFGGHTKEIRALTFIPPSATTPEILASAGDDLRIGLWNTHTGECIGILEGHDRGIWSLCYSPELQLLYSCSKDETIRYWDLATLTCVRTLTLPKPYQSMNITGMNGLSIATQTSLIALGSVAGTLKLHQ